MTFLLVLAAALLLLGIGAGLLLKADPAAVARSLRLVLPLLLGAAGLILTFAGRAGIGMTLISAAAGWFSLVRRSAMTRTPNRRSTVRTAALEMELDHDSGQMNGVVLAGRFEGKVLSDLDLPDLLELYGQSGLDADSVRLLETYLDGRFPSWREDKEADADPGHGHSAGTGAMTEQEAYEILGLEPGAAAAEIRKAHRRLMQRVHPDLGGSPFLAARINQAKDLLLRRR
jgi:hypothetical protein